MAGGMKKKLPWKQACEAKEAVAMERFGEWNSESI